MEFEKNDAWLQIEAKKYIKTMIPVHSNHFHFTGWTKEEKEKIVIKMKHKETKALHNDTIIQK